MCHSVDVYITEKHVKEDTHDPSKGLAIVKNDKGVGKGGGLMERMSHGDF